MLKYRKPKKFKKSKSNKSGAVFLKDGIVVETPKRKYLTWEPDRKIWEGKIDSRVKGYSAYRENVRDKYQPLIEERQRRIREGMKSFKDK